MNPTSFNSKYLSQSPGAFSSDYFEARVQKAKEGAPSLMSRAIQSVESTSLSKVLKTSIILEKVMPSLIGRTIEKDELVDLMRSYYLLNESLETAIKRPETGSIAIATKLVATTAKEKQLSNTAGAISSGTVLKQNVEQFSKAWSQYRDAPDLERYNNPLFRAIGKNIQSAHAEKLVDAGTKTALQSVHAAGSVIKAQKQNMEAALGVSVKDTPVLSMTMLASPFVKLAGIGWNWVQWCRQESKKDKLSELYRVVDDGIKAVNGLEISTDSPFYQYVEDRRIVKQHPKEPDAAFALGALDHAMGQLFKKDPELASLMLLDGLMSEDIEIQTQTVEFFEDRGITVDQIKKALEPLLIEKQESKDTDKAVKLVRSWLGF
jgi:hypothetical protein